MGRNLSDCSESPVRGRGSPRRRTPSQRARSPARHKSSYKASSLVREKPLSRARSPRLAKSKSPVSRSLVREKHSGPLREKPSSRTRSPELQKSLSPVYRSPSPRTKRLKRAQAEIEDEKASEREQKRNHRESDRSTHRRMDSKREVPSERREKSSGRDAVDDGSFRLRHKSISPVSRSPSPRTKRLRRAQADIEAEKGSEIEQKRKHRGSERSTHRGTDSEREVPRERREKRAGRDAVDNGSSRSRHKSTSPVSRSPSPRTKRLRRAQAETEAEKASEREQKRNRWGSDRSTHRETDSERNFPIEKRERRSGRDAVDNGSARSRHVRSTSPSDHHRRNKHRSRSPPTAVDFRSHDEVNNSRGGERGNGNDDSVAKMAAAAEALEMKEKQKPSFELSGKLAEETNRVRGVTLLFTEPPEARKPEIRWRLYVFKGGDVLNEPLYVHRQTSYLFGRERRVAEIPTDHPSCSKQHAVLQYRQVEKEQPDGTSLKRVRPYIMDLGSTNGTFINDERIEPHRYYELFEKDTIKFGNSSREYVLLHENSAG